MRRTSPGLSARRRCGVPTRGDGRCSKVDDGSVRRSDRPRTRTCSMLPMAIPFDIDGAPLDGPRLRAKRPMRGGVRGLARPRGRRRARSSTVPRGLPPWDHDRCPRSGGAPQAGAGRPERVLLLRRLWLRLARAIRTHGPDDQVCGQILGRPIDPAEVIVVGEPPLDVGVAKIAHAVSVPVASGRYGRDELERSGDEHVLVPRGELLPLLDAQFPGGH
jgi:hypothetical protein